MEKPRKKFTDTIDKALAAASKMHRDELLFSYKGILYPVTFCSPEVFRAMESFEARSDDIILAAYPKSGTNWVGQILNDLVAIFEKKRQNKETSVHDELLEEFPYLEIGDTEKYERMNKLPSPRIMITHLLPENLPRSIFKCKSKILLLIRNPKDLATSFFYFCNGVSTLPSYDTWDEFFTAFMTKKMAWGCYLEYLSAWNKYVDNENLMTITYEELKEVLGVKNIADFLGISLTEKELQTVVDRSSFQSMKKNSQKTHGTFGNVLFRKGDINDWKTLFSEDQNEKMDKAFEERMGGTKLGAKLKGILYPATVSSPETLEALKSFETRSDDVILAGYPKTGTTWLGEMVKELESTDAKYTEEEMKERINAEKELEAFPRLEFGDPEIYEILVLVRNPKDTAVSYYHFYNDMPVLPSFASWDEYFAAFMNGKLAWGSYIDHLVEWNKYIDLERIMVISYEELKEDQVLGMKRIAAFFGFSLCEEDFRRIAEKTGFQAMKEKSKETHGKFGDILFRKGLVGKWRDYFSKAQNEEMDQKFEDCLGGTKLAAKMKYDVYCKA